MRGTTSAFGIRISFDIRISDFGFHDSQPQDFLNGNFCMRRQLGLLRCDNSIKTAGSAIGHWLRDIDWLIAERGWDVFEF